MSLTTLARRMFRRALQPRAAQPRRSTTRLSLTMLEDRSVPYAISGTVFYDTNADGIQNNNESTAPGVMVSMMGPVSASGSTDNFGHFVFVEVPAGNYSVMFTAHRVAHRGRKRRSAGRPS